MGNIIYLINQQLKSDEMNYTDTCIEFGDFNEIGVSRGTNYLDTQDYEKYNVHIQEHHIQIDTKNNTLSQKITIYIKGFKMSKSLFDHIKQITNVQNPMYWESLDDGDKKTWSNLYGSSFSKYEIRVVGCSE